ncbi:MAG: UDP-N-acetylmuramate dehydrogenase, partial [Candidatus Omnitrophica bacterium]|nr:UDP-N-acetylmuramate dehydrogenase [Candidatus Omnitrophota bacterium]
RTGGPARFMVYPVNFKEISRLLKIAKEENFPFFILGGGSNILVSDQGFPGLVISTRLLNRITAQGERVQAEAGVRLAFLLKFCLQNRFGGIEFLGGIPGTLGGAIRMNAGLKRRWISSRIISVTAYEDQKEVSLRRQEIPFGYRKSGLESKFILSAEMQLFPSERKQIHSKIIQRMMNRRKKQPPPFRTAGSIFKNPPGHYAGKLIEDCQLKGFRLGQAQISPIHANIIVNTGRTTSTEIWQLICLVREAVRKQYNIELELEIQCLGEFPE